MGLLVLMFYSKIDKKNLHSKPTEIPITKILNNRRNLAEKNLISSKKLKILTVNVSLFSAVFLEFDKKEALKASVHLFFCNRYNSFPHMNINFIHNLTWSCHFKIGLTFYCNLLL